MLHAAPSSMPLALPSIALHRYCAQPAPAMVRTEQRDLGLGGMGPSKLAAQQRVEDRRRNPLVLTVAGTVGTGLYGDSPGIMLTPVATSVGKVPLKTLLCRDIDKQPDNGYGGCAEPRAAHADLCPTVSSCSLVCPYPSIVSWLNLDRGRDCPSIRFVQHLP